MKAAIIHRTGTASELQVAEISKPQAGPEEIRVKVAAAAVNPVDVKTRSGFLNLDLSFPAVLGWDVAGTVDEIGPHVSQFRKGDRVMGMVAQPVRGQGTYAEYVSAPAQLFAPIPPGLSMQQAAAAPLAVLTAAQTLSKLNLPNKAHILVTGAAGAVGRVALQWLLQAGHRVVGLARPHDTEDLTSLGADAVYDSTNGVADMSFDAVVDTAGIAATIVSVRDNGQFISIADNTQPHPERGIVPMKSYVQENGRQLAKIAKQMEQETISIPIGATYPLSRAADAHNDFERGGLRGKVLLIP